MDLDRSIFNRERHLPFVKDEGCKVTIVCDSGEHWEFAYETNKLFQLNEDKRSIMLVEECGEPRLLASRFLSCLESVRLSYPGLTDTFLPFVDVPDPSCKMKDENGREYVVTIGEKSLRYHHRYDDFHDLVVNACNDITDMMKELNYSDYSPYTHIMAELRTMDRYRAPDIYEPYYPSLITSDPDNFSELGPRLLKIAGEYTKMPDQIECRSTAMRYAVISDIHGNYSSLSAAQFDARSRGVDDFIFAGDYCLSNPDPDLCISVIRRTESAIVVRGNEERYLENLIGKDQNSWTDGQMQISYWNYRNVREHNLDYILGRPLTAETVHNGVRIRIAHQLDSFIDECEFRLFGPAVLEERYKDKEITPGYLSNEIKRLIEKDDKFMEQLKKLEDGIYVFGHSHIQWSYKVPGKDVYLVNPGSCGLPLDGIRNSIPYSIITISAEGEVSVEQIRIPFNMERYAESIKRSDQYKCANVWSKIIIKELLTSREHLTFFLRYVKAYAERIGDERRPFSLETWETAYEKWSNEYR